MLAHNGAATCRNWDCFLILLLSVFLFFSKHNRASSSIFLDISCAHGKIVIFYYADCLKT